MSVEIGPATLNIPGWIILIISFFLAFTITCITIPSIIKISGLKNLCDKPDERKSHSSGIPYVASILFTILVFVVIINGFNLAVILLAVALHHLGIIRLLWVVFITSFLVTSIPGLVFRYRVRTVITRVTPLGNTSWVLPLTFRTFRFKKRPIEL